MRKWITLLISIESDGSLFSTGETVIAPLSDHRAVSSSKVKTLEAETAIGTLIEPEEVYKPPPRMVPILVEERRVPKPGLLLTSPERRKIFCEAESVSEGIK